MYQCRILVYYIGGAIIITTVYTLTYHQVLLADSHYHCPLGFSDEYLHELETYIILIISHAVSKRHN